MSNVQLFHSLQIVPPLHFLLCSLNSKENFAYHLNSRVDPDDVPRMKPYERKTTEQSDAVKAAKKDFIERAKTHLGQLFDSPIASGTSGNSGKCLSFNSTFPVFNTLQVHYLLQFQNLEFTRGRRIEPAEGCIYQNQYLTAHSIK